MFPSLHYATIDNRRLLESLAKRLTMFGAGSGGGSAKEVERLMTDELSRIEYAGEVRLIKFKN